MARFAASCFVFVFSFITAAVLAVGSPTARAAEPVFKHTGIDADAQRFEKWLYSNWKPGKLKAEAHRQAGQQAIAQGDPRKATQDYARAVAAAPSDPRGWEGLARSLLAIPVNQLSGTERYRTPVNASAAAYLAYMRARSTADRARTLATLGEALVRRSYWRPALDAYKTSLALAENGAVRSSYEALRSEHGFRVANYRVENETARPRLCIEFSEVLKRGKVDFAPFIAVNGADAQTVSAEGEQLCVSGLKHGERYQVALRAGLPAEIDDRLEKNVELSVYVRDRSPTVRFSGRDYVLPSRGQRGLPVVSINTDAVEVEVFRIGDRSLVSAVLDGELSRQLSRWDANNLKEKRGTKVYSGTLKVRRDLNKEVSTALPVGEALPEMEPGVYAMVARPADKLADDNGNELATQWFIVSDLGLAAYTAPDGLHVFVRSLATARPQGLARVKLVARNNEVLATATTDVKGYARFDQRAARGEGGMAPALLVAESARGDYAFLDMVSGAFDLSDRGVKGRVPPGPVDGYLYTDRGVYRPGEQVNFGALVRDAKGQALDLTVNLIVTRPDGVQYRKAVLDKSQLGGHKLTMALGASAMTGTWRAALHTDPKAEPVARAAFLVEDFVPERLTMTLEAITRQFEPGSEGKVKLDGKYLYGPPAAQLAVDGEVLVKADPRGLAACPGYHFGLAEQRIDPVRGEIDSVRTDANGQVVVPVTLPAISSTPRPLVAEVTLRLKEAGGRAIERRVSVPVAAGMPRIGVKPLFKGDSLGEGSTAEFDVITLDAADRPIERKGVAWELVRLDQRWQWYKRDGTWTYDAITVPQKIADGSLDVVAGNPVRISAPVNWGRYRLDITASDGQPLATSYLFNAGWYATGDADSPEVLAIALDKQSYSAGEKAKLKLSTRSAGTAMVAVFSGGLSSVQDVAVVKGDNEIELPVTGDWGTGAYVLATLYRSLDEANRRMPGRAIGVAWLGLDQSPRTLRVKLDPPEKVRSGSKLSVPVTIEGLAAGETARLTVAAVDVGVLNLTRFVSPDPASWFFAQPRLGTEVRDLYGRLIDGMQAERGALKSGGDADAGGGLNGSPPVEETLALFSGIVATGPDGRANIEFDMPDFNGAVRLMAVAWSASRVGHSDREVIVRDKVAITTTAPRFLNLGDRAVMQVDLHNVEAGDETFKLMIAETYGDAEPRALVEREIRLAAGARVSERVAIAPNRLGRVTYDVFVTGPGGVDVKRDLIFDVKPPARDVRRTLSTRLEPGGRLELASDLIAGMVPGNTVISLDVGPMARLDVPGLLAMLDRYPYGCAEQTVSRALPLVYANALSATVGLSEDKALKPRVQAAIDRVFSMQDSSGAFGAWGPSYADIWLSSYVADFLTRAREAGFTVDPRGFGQALDRLANHVAYVSDFTAGGEKRAYALYVLARNGRAPIGELRYYADARLDRFATPLAKAQIGAALAMAGDKARAERAFNAALSDLGDIAPSDSRADYGSPLRDAAAVLTLMSEARALPGPATELANRLAEAYGNRRQTSTQEQSWLLLAARGMAVQGGGLQLVIDGAEHQGPLKRTFTPAEITGGKSVLHKAGEPTDAVVTVIGSSAAAVPAESQGYTISRQYFTLDGQPLDLTSTDQAPARLAQGDRLVVVLTITGEAAGGRSLLVDRLPAGLEIENPRIVESGDVKALSWLKSDVYPDHTEFRDDRFVAAFDFFRAGDEKRSATVAYVVRAVSSGSFVHPAALVEDMYRPDRFARTAAGRLEIQAR